MSETLRIATRESPLAMWQSEHVRARLEAVHPGLRVELLPMTTRGDQMLEHSLARVGGKGLFVKELERALLDGRADLAVHSMKDMPAEMPPGLGLQAFLSREDPTDALVGRTAPDLAGLPPGAVVGTASLRRQALLRLQRPDLEIRELRGNVNSRLGRLDDGQFDAIVLASAGLRRLGLADRITETLSVSRFVPAPGQGVIGVQTRSDDAATNARVAALDDAASRDQVAAERALSARLGGACHVPVACFARLDGPGLHIDALVAMPDGRRVIRDALSAGREEAAMAGRRLADRLIEAGARDILDALADTA